MQQPNQLAAHEMMEIHELLNFKTICTAKAKAMDGLVTDRELKQLMQLDLQQSMQALNNLQALLTRAHAQ
ncbi:spore coat protein [Alicyclobacillus fastidiosus]